MSGRPTCDIITSQHKNSSNFYDELDDQVGVQVVVSITEWFENRAYS